MNKRKQVDVKVPADARPADWAWQKAQAMHESLAGKADRAEDQRQARLAARAERKQARVAA